jgi:hypothetical protein
LDASVSKSIVIMADLVGGNQDLPTVVGGMLSQKCDNSWYDLVYSFTIRLYFQPETEFKSE